MLWFSHHKSHHEGKIPDALALAKHIKKLSLEHHSAWGSKSHSPSVERRALPPSEFSRLILTPLSVTHSQCMLLFAGTLQAISSKLSPKSAPLQSQLKQGLGSPACCQFGCLPPFTYPHFLRRLSGGHPSSKSP